jgi:oligoendopeptidase F
MYMEIKQKKRAEIDSAFKWRLEDLYKTEVDWRAALDSVTEQIAVIQQYRGQLANPSDLLNCLNAVYNAGEIIGRLYVYAHMKSHEDTSDTIYQGMADTAVSADVKFRAVTAFIEPEILSNLEDTDALNRVLSAEPGMALYKHYLENLLRQKAHILSAEAEEILANAGEIGNAADNIFSMLQNADMKFGTITDENGDRVEVTNGRYISLVESSDRRVRKDVFDTYYDSYWKQKNTIAAAYNASVKKDLFFSKTRKHPSALDSALFDSNIPREVYKNLIAAVHEALPELHRYVRLRKKALNLPDLHMYDLYTPIIADADRAVSYDEAKEKVLLGLAPLGEDYLAAVRSGLENGWVDVYENEGKNSGAYSWGAYGVHPYILMNYDNKLDDMFTLAHEFGHSLHSYYTWASQPYIYGDYTTFLAEVASTVNEALLMQYLLGETSDGATRAYLLNHFLEQYRGTVFRQTMFAEFEMFTHEMAERGEPLTVDSLNTLYRELNLKYYGPDIIVDDSIDLEWGRIPHFYSAFYVYQYATGFSAAMAFASRILQPGDAGREAVERYLAFLKSGSSDYSINILKKAGVDMSSPVPVREALAQFKTLLDQMEGLV